MTDVEANRAFSIALWIAMAFFAAFATVLAIGVWCAWPETYWHRALITAFAASVVLIPITRGAVVFVNARWPKPGTDAHDKTSARPPFNDPNWEIGPGDVG